MEDEKVPLTDNEVRIAKDIRKVGIKTLFNYMQKIVEEEENIVSDFTAFDMSSWIAWTNLWIKDKLGSPIKKDVYDRRKLVTVNLGTCNIDSEASYEHPAIILYNDFKSVLIAPMTSKKYGKGLSCLIDVPKEDCPGLTENSTIQLDNIRCISKKRITGTLRGLLPVEYMDKVDDALLKLYIPRLNIKMNNLIIECDKLRKENEQLKRNLDLDTKIQNTIEDNLGRTS